VGALPLENRNFKSQTKSPVAFFPKSGAFRGF
jgi:hypothetical protein